MKKLNEFLVTRKQKRQQEYKIYRHDIAGHFPAYYVVFTSPDQAEEFANNITDKKIHININVFKHLFSERILVGIRPDETRQNRLGFNVIKPGRDEFIGYLDSPEDFSFDYWK